MKYYLSVIALSILLFFGNICVVNSQAIKEIDSLNLLYKNAPYDTIKVFIACQIGKKFWFNKPDTSITICMKALEIAEKINYKKGIAFCYHVIAGAYDTKGNPALSLDYNFKALKIREEIGDQEGIGNSLNNIGIIYLYQKNYEMALECYLKNMKYDWDVIHDTLESATDMSNIAEVYKEQGNFENALAYYNKSKKIQEKHKREYGLLNIYYNIADIYDRQSNLEQAFFYAKKGLAIAKRSQNLEYLSGCNRVLASIYLKMGSTDLCIAHGVEALEAAQEINGLIYVKPAAQILYKVYKDKNDYKNAHEYYLISIAANDSLYNLDKVREMSSMQYTYVIEDKKKEIALLTKDKKLAQQQTLLFGGGFVFFACLAFLFFRARQKERRAKQLLAEQKAQIEDKNEELYQLNEEITTQRDMLFQQKKDITDSMEYARFIQQALLASHEVLDNCQLQNFILYKPRDIISGDFYWFKQVKNYVYFTAADCTGHGVPGAFMSVLGISLLNEIVGKRDLNPPAMVLNELRKRLKKSLKQDDPNSTSRDGMDIALCLLDVETKQLQFAGAYNPLFVIRNNELIELKADKMPVAVHPKDSNEFTNHKIQLLPNDTLYIFSDGYLSQFGGTEGKKLNMKQFKNLLLKASNLPIEKQQSHLDECLAQWQGNIEQVDDLLVIGVRV